MKVNEIPRKPTATLKKDTWVVLLGVERRTAMLSHPDVDWPALIRARIDEALAALGEKAAFPPVPPRGGRKG